MEHIEAAWDMAGLAIDAVEELAIGLAAVVVAAEALVGRQVEICP